MKIAETEWIVYDRQHDRDRGNPKLFLVLCLRADDGAEGCCDLPMWHRDACRAEERRKFGPLLLGKDPLERDAIWQMLYGRGLSLPLISYVDVALWDLYGRVEGKPVHALLGTRRDKIAVYNSTPFNVGPPQAYAEDAVRCKERGFRGYKIHPYRVWDGENDADKDVPVYRAVREAVGSGFPLMCDNYYSYDFDEAVHVGKVLDELDYMWYESPMPENDEWLDRYVALRGEVRTPICAPETAPGAHETRIRWIERGATDMGRLDVFFGGFTSCWKTAVACRKAGIPMDLHCALFPHMQVFGATSEELIPYMEGYAYDRCYDIDEDGYTPIPQGPGMAFDLDWDFIRARRVEGDRPS